MTRARAKTGPKTTAGKSRSRENARKHGLAALLSVPKSFPREDQLVRLLLDEHAVEKFKTLASAAAKARVRLEQIRKVRMIVLQALITGSGELGESEHIDNAENVLRLVKNLRRLERYESRALSRWYRNVHEMIEEEGRAAQLKVVDTQNEQIFIRTGC
jgi:hypothetical protein